METHIKRIESSTLTDIRFALDMLMLSFSSGATGIDGYMHIQSGWQLIHDGHIVLASLDMFESDDPQVSSRNAVIRQCRDWIASSPPIVESVWLKDFLELDIVLSEDWRVRTVTLSAESVAGSDRELWRIENLSESLSIVAELGGGEVSIIPREAKGGGERGTC